MKKKMSTIVLVFAILAASIGFGYLVNHFPINYSSSTIRNVDPTSPEESISAATVSDEMDDETDNTALEQTRTIEVDVAITSEPIEDATDLSVPEDTTKPTEPEVAPTYMAIEPKVTEPAKPHSHSYSASVVAPTCTAKGYTLHKCSCGDSYKDSYTEATGHKYTKAEVVAPTCKNQGYTIHKCACGDSYKDTYTDKTNNHSYKDKVVAATCSKEGYTEHTCTVCGYSTKDSYTATTDHTLGDVDETIMPTTTTEGCKIYHCKVCGAEVRKYYPRYLNYEECKWVVDQANAYIRSIGHTNNVCGGWTIRFFSTVYTTKDAFLSKLKGAADEASSWTGYENMYFDLVQVSDNEWVTHLCWGNA